MIDLIGQDPKTGEVVLVMNQPDEWAGSDEQLLALQERFNAYVSFLLDGELSEAHPELADKPARIELRCAHIPDTREIGRASCRERVYNREIAGYVQRELKQI